MADAQSITATPEDLPQKIVEAINKSVKDVAIEVQDLESSRQDKFVRATETKKIDKRFPPQAVEAIRPLDSAQIAPTEMNPQGRPQEDRRRLEQEHKAKMARNRQDVKRQMKQYHDQPLQVSPKTSETEKRDIETQVKRYSKQSKVASPKVRAQINKSISSKAKKKASEDIEQKTIEKVTAWIWRGASDLPIAETEGVAGWSVFIFGFISSWVRVLITIFNPQSPKWLKHGKLDPKDIVTWGADIPAVFYYLFIGIVILLVVHAILLVILLAIGALLGVAEWLNFINIF